MDIVPHTTPKVAPVQKNKASGQMDLFAPAIAPVPPASRKMRHRQKYFFTSSGDTPSHITCPRCSRVKSPSEFQKDNAGMFGLHAFCLDCQRKYNRKRYEADGGKETRRRHLKDTYGITIEEYDAMLNAQGGVCAICGNKGNGNYRGTTARAFAVDHCHQTGRVRGLLCSNCNTGIGALKDSTAIMDAAISYLRKQT